MSATLPTGQFIGVMPVRYVGDLLKLGNEVTERQISPTYELSQRQCPHWPVISSLHDLALVLMGRPAKPIYRVNYVIRDMGEHQFHTYLYRPLIQRRSFVRFLLDGFKHPAKDPSQHLAVLVHANTGEGYLIVGSKFQGALIERGSNNTSTGGVNILTRFIDSKGGTPRVALFGADFETRTNRSILSLERATVSDKALGTLNKILDQPNAVSHCQEVGVLQSVGLAAKTGYGCSTGADALLSHTDPNHTACGSSPKIPITTPMTIGGKPVSGGKPVGARAFAINPFLALKHRGAGPNQGVQR